MGKSTPSAPRAPDPSFVSQQQTQSNVNTAVANAYLNNTNQRTPQGSLTYNQTGTQNVGGIDVPQFTATQTLSPEQQHLYDTGVRTNQGIADLGERYTGQIADATRTPFDYTGIPNAPGAPTLPNVPTASAIPQYDDAYQGHVYDQMLARAAPQQERDRAALQNRLANQGIPNAGSEAGDAEWRNYNTGINDFRTAADLASGQAATQRYQNQLQGQGQNWGQQAQGFGMGMDRAQTDFTNQGAVRDRAISDTVRRRTQAINEASALFQLGGGVQNPNYVNTPQNQVAPTDVMGAYNNQYQGQLAQQQMAMQSNNAAMGGLSSLAGSAMGMAGMYFL